MPSDRSTNSPHSGYAYHLGKKLEKLQEMLVLTERISRDPFGVAQKDAENFRDRTGALSEEIRKIDQEIKDCGRQEADPFRAPQYCKALQGQISETLQRLSRENSNLMASIKAQQEIIGEKIARLKQNKDLLRTYQPNLPKEPTIVDSSA
ncbi:MAG: hypothetical protein ACYTG7_11445 [Planctomycetota bacterium]|jgi:archaellum component FlaC